MPVFDGVAEYAAEGCFIKPLWFQFMQDETLKFAFDLHIERPLPRPWDGWFHASQHPMATERELYLYLTQRKSPEPRDYAMNMSAFFGTMTHGMFEAFLHRMGVAVPLPKGDCPACGRPYKPPRARQSPKYCMEHGAAHLETRARCHLDSIVAYQGHTGFDLKTIQPYGLKGVHDMEEAAFKEKWPRYWGQMQECMRITGLRKYIVFFLGLGIPWMVREFHFNFDPVFAAQTEAKYRRVLDAVDRGVEIAA